MRILELRFQNLNSLEGKWHINFTHPAFARDGIFAITGPTGAGKSTILDAICLALYGCTPRLGKITKSQNEIMSRRAGECAAELVFETEEGRFRCQWSQHRARKKPGGELQNQRHEAANADTGKILASGIKDTADFVEEKTGLNFDRFTRSMLLAQGGFAVFLQAGPDERSPILEEITGTEIYSRISMAAHDRASEEKKEFALLKREISGMNLLGQGEREGLEKEIAAKKSEEKTLSSEITMLSAGLSWREGLRRLEMELSALKGEEEKLNKEREAFAPLQRLLHRANLARTLFPEFAGLDALRGEFLREENEQQQLEKNLPELRQGLQQAESLLKEAEAEHLGLQGRHEKILPVLRQARDLDWQIREQEKPILKLADDMTAGRNDFASLQMRHEKTRKELSVKRDALATVALFLSENTADGILSREFAGIRALFLRVERLVQERAVNAKKRETGAKQAEKSEKALSGRRLLLEKNRLSMEEAQAKAEDAAKKLEQMLGQEDLGVWRKKRDALRERDTILSGLCETLNALDGAKKEVAEIGQEREGLFQEESALDLEKRHREKELTLLSEKERLLERAMRFSQKIASLEEERKLLREGEACPLCGALEHPYASGDPLPEEDEKALEETRETLLQLRDTLTGLQVRHAEIRKSLEHLEVRERALQEKILSWTVFAEKTGSDHDLFSENPDAAPEILMAENHRALETMAVFVEKAEALEKSRSGLEREAWEKKEAFHREEGLFLSAVHERDKALENVKVLEEAGQEIFLRFEASMEALGKELEPFGVPLPAPEDFDKTLDTLGLRKETWEKRTEEKHGLEREIIGLATRLEKEGEAVASLESLLLKQAEDSSRMKEARDALLRERFVLFGEKNPDAEEAALKAALDLSEKKRRMAEAKTGDAGKKIHTVEARLSHLKQSMAGRKELLLEREDAFCNNLEALGFADEADFVSSRMEEEKRGALAEKEESLIKASHALEVRKREKEDLLADELGKNLAEEDAAVLQEKLFHAKERERILQLETGGLLSRLSEDDRLREKQKSLIESLEAREKEVRRWEILDSLIGSHDGKKYRNFVQGLTLELVVEHANHHLQKITDRYILVRDKTHPLDLQVVDTWQADEIRTTKNLSGGESFLVSLALALGLSRMSGNNVRMDSLFLDEGFGTLDEDALETALSALSSLRSEGKLIGLISHVAELKERIPTRIELVPSRDGRSLIRGPGCS